VRESLDAVREGKAEDQEAKAEDRNGGTGA
jgi:hypothetical protein